MTARSQNSVSKVIKFVLGFFLGKNFAISVRFSATLHTGFETHPASSKMGTASASWS